MFFFFFFFSALGPAALRVESSTVESAGLGLFAAEEGRRDGQLNGLALVFQLEAGGQVKHVLFSSFFFLFRMSSFRLPSPAFWYVHECSAIRPSSACSRGAAGVCGHWGVQRGGEGLCVAPGDTKPAGAQGMRDEPRAPLKALGIHQLDGL